MILLSKRSALKVMAMLKKTRTWGLSPPRALVLQETQDHLPGMLVALPAEAGRHPSP